MNRAPAGLVVFAALLGSPDPAVAEGSPGQTPEALLFSYFVGNGERGLYLAHSADGLAWQALNRGKPLLAPELGEKTLMRDPSIARGPDGTFHLVFTTSWNRRSIGYASSKDLVTWSEQRAIPVMEHEPGARNCWAPELLYDQPSRKYVIAWSSTVTGRFPETAGSSESDYNHRIYATTTEAFQEFSPTRLLYDPGFNVIDAAIVRDGSRCVMFLKDERLRPEPKKRLLWTTAKDPLGPYGKPSGPITSQTWVEGPSAVRIDGLWHVYFDCYTRKRYGCATSKDLQEWTDVSDRLKMPPGTRHGTVFRADRAVLEGLLKLGE